MFLNMYMNIFFKEHIKKMTEAAKFDLDDLTLADIEDIDVKFSTITIKKNGKKIDIRSKELYTLIEWKIFGNHINEKEEAELELVQLRSKIKTLKQECLEMEKKNERVKKKLANDGVFILRIPYLLMGLLPGVVAGIVGTVLYLPVLFKIIAMSIGCAAVTILIIVGVALGKNINSIKFRW